MGYWELQTIFFVQLVPIFNILTMDIKRGKTMNTCNRYYNLGQRRIIV